MAVRQDQNFSNIRVRFAPSPTGYLHIGSARTALFNYLLARRHGGTFILRIEDTDKVRSTSESLENLVSGLHWLGITWDEGPDPDAPGDTSRDIGDYGPYLQSARSELHMQAARQLFDQGKAFECICPPQESMGAGKCRCAEKSREISSLPREEKSLKFKIPPGPPVVVRDMIRGEVVFKRDDLQDFIIVRADGYPTYNFVAVIDDSAMKITHVVRGEDHLPNTPKQMLIYEALDLVHPAFAHIPLIHGSDGTRMSKRHGTVGVHEYRDEGFLPEAFVNYLAMLGWNDNTDKELYSLHELEHAFNLRQVNSSPAAFDREKLLWYNGKYIRMLDGENLFQAALPFLGKWVDPVDINQSTREWLTGILALYRERIEILSDLPGTLSYFFDDPQEYSEQDLMNAKVTGEAFAWLIELKKRFEKIGWSREDIEKCIREFVAEKGVKLGNVVHPLRLIVTGTTATPGIFDTLFYVGKEAVLRRVEKFLASYQPPK